ncbi:hypothetical protein [Clostridium tarantellae]|uniref:ABC transporter permease subunit n=1 Tax=Clostridium tarantellae TaxID=39493 RepID=A0A6I1MPU7_9CLOT|nr:hypothetical protein [Clostridium tarantellae]MPQ45084.1 hypothetical protein [Clostridium tarantellae]
MKNYFKQEFYRALTSKNTLITFLITLILFVTPFIFEYSIPKWSLCNFKEVFDGIDIFIKITNGITSVGILLIVAPILACLPFSTSYLEDKESGFLKYIYMRKSQRKYIFIKIFINALVSGLAILIPATFMLLFLIILLGINVNSLSSNDFSGAFMYIYNYSKLGYAVFLLISLFIFNVIFSTLALGVSPWLKNKYLTIVFPFFYYIFSGTILEISGFNRIINLKATYLFTLGSFMSDTNIILYQLGLFIVGLALFYFGVIFKDEKNI